MDVERKKMYSQVYSILNLFGDEYINKLPHDLYKLIDEERLDEYNPEYDLDTLLEDKTIMQDTYSMIALFNSNYWSGMNLNKSTIEENYKNIEKSKKIESEEYVTAYDSLAKPKEGLFVRFINMIKKFFGEE